MSDYHEILRTELDLVRQHICIAAVDDVFSEIINYLHVMEIVLYAI